MSDMFPPHRSSRVDGLVESRSILLASLVCRGEVIMPADHNVEQGDCLASIAHQYGFADWRTIYNDDLNDALRQSRNDPNVLFPGDRVAIPDKKVRVEIGQTTMVHTYRIVRKPTRLRLVVRDVDGTVLGGKRYRLVVDGVANEGTLPDNGMLDRLIPPDASHGELAVWTDEDS